MYIIGAVASSEPASFPFAVLTMAITSTLATLLYTLPPFRRLVLAAAGL